ncbi:MAG: heavy-metal-associated domain-containing protein [Betaproteobacteria bacterium]|nr:heavy-metal-associated domain-containing protein [Betaproteobacteria bacterium]
MKSLVAALVLSIAASGALADVRTIRAEVKGVVCAFCAQSIEKKMRSLSQTQDVYVDLKNKVVAVEMKEGQTLSQDNVRDLIKDAGYDVGKMGIVTSTAQQIKASLRAKK